MADKDNQYNLITPPSVLPPAPTLNLAAIVPLFSLPMLQRFNIKPEDADTPIATSYLGTPIYSNLVFKYDPDAGTDGWWGQSDLRIDTCLFNIQCRKNIVLTTINGRKDKNGKEIGGTVKEYISMGDYEINCIGEFVGHGALQYPIAEANYFNAICRLPKQVSVVSDFLNIFGIGSIVITDFGIAEKPGSRNEILFNFSALSDIDINVNTQGV